VGRVRTLAAIAAVCPVLLAAGSPAAAARPARSEPKLVRELIRIMRRDARRQALVRPGHVTVKDECCGRRTVAVHHEVHPGPHVLSDSYVLRTESRRGRVQRVVLFEGLTEADPASGLTHLEAHFEWVLERSRTAPSRWRGHDGEDDLLSYYSPPGGPGMGSGGSKQCSPPSADRRFLRAMLRVVRNARRHRSSAAVAACG
jgi:hypothetical protein